MGWGIVDAVAALNWLNTTDVATAPLGMPTRLEANVPNPFNPSTRLRYVLSSRMHVTLRVYDMAGRRVRTLVEAIQPSGSYFTEWDGSNDGGRRVSAGVYLCRLETQPLTGSKALPGTHVRKMVLLP